jgi:hypothetical protein
VRGKVGEGVGIRQLQRRNTLNPLNSAHDMSRPHFQYQSILAGAQICVPGAIYEDAEVAAVTQGFGASDFNISRLT